VPADLRFDTYYRYDELTRLIHVFAEERPDLVKVESLGKSFQGREIWLAIVTHFVTGPAEDKPAFWVDANIHASEIAPSSAALYLIWKLTTQDVQSAEIKRLLDSRAFYIVPRVNPDGTELALADSPRWIRSTVRPYPFDEEPIDGLNREDIDGNGKMLTMRIVDPNGAWTEHPDEPRLLIRREPASTGGTYYRVLPEGRLTNYDGVQVKIQKAKEGLDLNRNFPVDWRTESEQPGAGEYPTSEPEVRALVDFIVRHPNITGGVSLHTQGGLLLRPYGTKSDDEMIPEDLRTYKKIGAKGTAITGYPNISTFHDYTEHPKDLITGVCDDWLYEHVGVFSWTTEIWAPLAQAGIKDYKHVDWYHEHPVEDDLKLLKWNDEVLGGKGYLPWKPFDHPDLGAMEIGGWDHAYCWRNPPPDFLEAEIAPISDWLIWHALISPKLEIKTCVATKLGDDVFGIRLVVQNTGWLPTYVTKKALERQNVRPVIAELELPEKANFVTGRSREELGQLEGRCYKAPSVLALTADPTDDCAKFDWVIQAPPGSVVKITARHSRAGTVRTEVCCSGFKAPRP
jgi:murein tripeptide amidase MpaA